jgi:hypothetical protein
MALSRRVLGAIVAAGLIGPALLSGTASAATVTATYPTAIANVHVRSLPSNVSPSKIVATIAAAGTSVTVNCYTTQVVAGVTHTWYHSTAPDTGYVAGRNLVIPHPKTPVVPHC